MAVQPSFRAFAIRKIGILPRTLNLAISPTIGEKWSMTYLQRRRIRGYRSHRLTEKSSRIAPVPRWTAAQPRTHRDYLDGDLGAVLCSQPASETCMQENFRQFLDRLRQAGELVDLHQPVDIRHIATLVDQAKTA